MSSDFAYLRCLSVCGGVVVFPRRMLKFQWEKMLADRLAVSRSTVMKTKITVSDLFIHRADHPVHIVDMETPIHVRAISLAALMYVLAYSKRCGIKPFA